MYVILLRLDMQDISSFKIELGVKRKMSLLESYTNYLWKCDKDGNNEGEKINSRFKEMAQKRWKLLRNLVYMPTYMVEKSLHFVDRRPAC